MLRSHRHARTWLAAAVAVLATTVLATTGLATTGLATTGLAVGGAGALTGLTLAQPATALTLTSVGSDSLSSSGESTDPAIAENGRYVAFSSNGRLTVSAAVPQTVAGESQLPGQIFVRDETGKTTVLLSDAGAGSATAPSISANGRLVGYDLNNGNATYVDVTDRQATGTGSFDAKANLAVRQVTGTARDLPFERIPDCTDGGEAPEQAVPCGPRLAADGSTLVYAAQLSPVSPALTPNPVFDEGSARQGPAGRDSVRLASFSQGPANPGNIVDIGEFEQGDSGFDAAEVDYATTGGSPLALSGVSITGPFTVSPSASGQPACTGTLKAGATCGVQVNFDASQCPADVPAMETGQLTTGAADPAGQSEITVAAYCVGAPFTSSGPASERSGPRQPRVSVAAARFPQSASAPAAACPAPPVPAAGLPLVQAPAQQRDDVGGTLTDLGPAETGEPYVAWMTVTPQDDGLPGDVVMRSADCALQPVDPASLRLANPVPGELPPTCSAGLQVGGSGDPDSCTLFMLVNPATAATSSAAVSFEFPRGNGTGGFATDLVSVTGVSDVVIARRDASGAGNFAASPSTVVSVDGSGQRIPGASQPSVSANGQDVAFAAPVPVGLFGAQTEGATEIFLHGAGAAGLPHGTTTLVSCLPGGTTCARASNAGSPSVSGDGGSVAFEAFSGPGTHEEVYARQVTAGHTVLVSAAPFGTAGDDGSFTPAMSQDGTTVAYVSDESPADEDGAPQASSLFVRTLVFGPGNDTEMVPGTRQPFESIGLPAIDAHGQQISFQSSRQLLPQAPAEVTSVYTFERFPHLVVSPATLGFGTLATGSPPQTRGVTVTDTGPGPAPVTGTAITQPFTLLTDTCSGGVLYAGTSCQITVQFSPLHAGQDHSTVSLTSGDDAEPVISIGVPVSATVVTPAAPQLRASPAVSIAGQVTQVTGTGFPAGLPVTLSWQPGLGTVTVTATASGTIAAPMVIFPQDVTGQRMLIATDGGGTILAKAPFLVELPSPEPPFSATPGPPATSAAP